MNKIQTNYKLDEIKLEEIKYGLESFYITITKAIVIFICALLLGTLKETILLLIFFNVLRFTSFGLHASKSWICWIASILVFIGLPILTQYFMIPKIIKFILCIVAVILIFLYAPADTKKHPLVNPKKRKTLKYISTFSTVILSILSFIFINLSNLIIFAIYIEIVLILPITYRIFKFEYRNYEKV